MFWYFDFFAEISDMNDVAVIFDGIGSKRPQTITPRVNTLMYQDAAGIKRPFQSNHKIKRSALTASWPPDTNLTLYTVGVKEEI